MARPIWTGTISFGLLHVPIRLYTGERSVDLHLRMLDSRDNQPIRYERVNAETGKEVPWKDIVKAFEYRKGNYVVIDEDDLKKAAPKSKETIELETFVDRESIDPRYFDKPYLTTPDKKASRPYVLLRETLARTGKVGIAKVVIRTRQYLSMLMPLGSALVLILMRFPQELVDPEDYKLPEGDADDFGIGKKELDMATQLIESMSSAWSPDDFKDDFRDRLRQIIEQRVKEAPGGDEEQEDPAPAETVAASGDDFMALLRDSLNAQRGKPEGRSPRGGSRRRSTRGDGETKKKASGGKRKS